MTTPYIQGGETVQRENLLDQLTVLFPSEAPLLRTVPHTAIANVVHEWPMDRPFVVDTVRNPNTPHSLSRAEYASYVVDTPAYHVRPRAVAEINHFSKKVSNTDRVAILAGTTNAYDYRAHQLFVQLINNIENILMYGRGAEEFSGVSNNRNTMGLIFSSAWTGLERMHAATPATTLLDPYAIGLAQDYWSTFYDANGANLSRKMLYDKILATAARSGAEIEGMLFHCGYKLKNLIADFGVNLAGTPVNERTVGADKLMTYDSIDWIRTPLGTIGFRSNRYLDLEGKTYTVDNTVTITGATSTGGEIDKTFQADETLIGMMPGFCSVGWYRPPHYSYVPTDGDFSWVAATAEFAWITRHPVAVCGGGNLLS
jgi:hypothetical protein